MGTRHSEAVMAGHSTLTVRRDSDHPRVLRISLNRPTRLNALTPALLSGEPAHAAGARSSPG